MDYCSCGGILNIFFIFYVQDVCPMASMHPKDLDAQLGGVDDMMKLTYLDELRVLYNLSSIYELDAIYVSVVLPHIMLMYLLILRGKTNKFGYMWDIF
jgi:hypothetical protein